MDYGYFARMRHEEAGCGVPPLSYSVSLVEVYVPSNHIYYDTQPDRRFLDYLIDKRLGHTSSLYILSLRDLGGTINEVIYRLLQLQKCQLYIKDEKVNIGATINFLEEESKTSANPYFAFNHFIRG